MSVIQVGWLSRYVSLAAIALGFFVAAALLLLYVLHFGRSDFSSDDAVLSLLAESMWEQGTLFPVGWIGNNGDLMVPSGALLLAPLLTWFPNSYELHAVASVFAIVLMLGTFSSFLLKGKVPLPVVLIAATVLASGPSRLSAMMLYLQTTYVWWPSAFFLCATLIWRARDEVSMGAARSIYLIPAVACIVFLATFANPGRALLMVVFPLYVFDRVLALRLHSSRTIGIAGLLSRLGARDSIVLFGLGAGFIIAALAYYGLFQVGTVHTVNNASSLRWDGLAGVAKHWKLFHEGWFGYLGSMREMNGADGALESILRPLRFAFAIWLTWVGVAEVVRLFRVRDPLRGALAAAFLAAFVPTLVLYVSFAPLAIDIGTVRYFTVPIVMLLAMAAFRVSGTPRKFHWMGYPISVVFSIFMILVCAVRFVPATSQPGMGFLDLRDSFAFRLTSVLESENLVWGYATWWNAGVTTILSSGKVRTIPVDFRGSNIVRFPCMIQQHDYMPQPYDGETFLLLRPGEATSELVSAMQAKLGEPSRVVRSDDAFIYVYPENISSKFCRNGPELNASLDSGGRLGRIERVERIARREDIGFETISVLVSNEGTETLVGSGRNPVSIGIDLLDDKGALVAPDWLHYPLPCAVDPDERRVFVIELPEIPVESRQGKIGLLQEGIARFEQWGIEPMSLPLDGLESDRISVKNMDPR